VLVGEFGESVCRICAKRNTEHEGKELEVRQDALKKGEMHFDGVFFFVRPRIDDEGFLLREVVPSGAKGNATERCQKSAAIRDCNPGECDTVRRGKNDDTVKDATLAHLFSEDAVANTRGWP
jgi:hypothetical protein